jgi:hypothetical protein
MIECVGKKEKKNAFGILVILLSDLQSLPQCWQDKLQHNVHSQKNTFNSCVLTQT